MRLRRRWAGGGVAAQRGREHGREDAGRGEEAPHRRRMRSPMKSAVGSTFGLSCSSRVDGDAGRGGDRGERVAGAHACRPSRASARGVRRGARRRRRAFAGAAGELPSCSDGAEERRRAASRRAGRRPARRANATASGDGYQPDTAQISCAQPRGLGAGGGAPVAARLARGVDHRARGVDERARRAARERARDVGRAARPARRRRAGAGSPAASACAPRRRARGCVAPTTAPTADRPFSPTTSAPHSATCVATWCHIGRPSESVTSWMSPPAFDVLHDAEEARCRSGARRRGTARPTRGRATG